MIALSTSVGEPLRVMKVATPGDGASDLAPAILVEPPTSMDPPALVIRAGRCPPPTVIWRCSDASTVRYSSPVIAVGAVPPSVMPKEAAIPNPGSTDRAANSTSGPWSPAARSSRDRLRLRTDSGPLNDRARCERKGRDIRAFPGRVTVGRSRPAAGDKGPRSDRALRVAILSAGDALGLSKPAADRGTRETVIARSPVRTRLVTQRSRCWLLG